MAMLTVHEINNQLTGINSAKWRIQKTMDKGYYDSDYCEPLTRGTAKDILTLLDNYYNLCGAISTNIPNDVFKGE